MTRLVESIAGLAPEKINDGENTAPKKRLKNHLRNYHEIHDGVEVVRRAGLPTLRQRCPRFDRWLTRLESLAP